MERNVWFAGRKKISLGEIQSALRETVRACFRRLTRKREPAGWRCHFIGLGTRDRKVSTGFSGSARHWEARILVGYAGKKGEHLLSGGARSSVGERTLTRGPRVSAPRSQGGEARVLGFGPRFGPWWLARLRLVSRVSPLFFISNLFSILFYSFFFKAFFKNDFEDN